MSAIEVSRQLGAPFASGRAADRRSDLVKRFLAACRKGTRACHDAFVGPHVRASIAYDDADGARRSTAISRCRIRSDRQPGRTTDLRARMP